MLESLKRWIAGQGEHGPGGVLSDWGRERGWRIARTEDGATWVAEERHESKACRIEWGPSQRSSLGAHELRIRGPLAAPASLQMLAMTANLANALEMDAYRNARDGSTGALNPEVSEEARWLGVLPRVNVSGLSAPARNAAVCLASHVSVAREWLAEGVAQQLALAPVVEPAGSARVQAVVHRGRLTVRLGVEALDRTQLEWAVAFYALAHRAAAQAAEHLFEGGEWSTTASATWVQSSLPNRGQVVH